MKSLSSSIIASLFSDDESNDSVDNDTGNKSLNTTSKFVKLLLFNTCRVPSENLASSEGSFANFAFQFSSFFSVLWCS